MYQQKRGIFLNNKYKNSEIMKNLKIEYKRENGSIDFEEVSCKTIKLTKSIRNYFNDINAEIISITEMK